MDTFREYIFVRLCYFEVFKKWFWTLRSPKRKRRCSRLLIIRYVCILACCPNRVLVLFRLGGRSGRKSRDPQTDLSGSFFAQQRHIGRSRPRSGPHHCNASRAKGNVARTKFARWEEPRSDHLRSLVMVVRQHLFFFAFFSSTARTF